MPVTVKVNGVANSLVHKGSNGISIATIPDVCKTPSPGGPIPIPYPNISQSATLAKGTTTVKADGGMMIANKGSEFSLSNGDNPGVVGGVKSSTFMKESTWILYSFDVKIDGKNACRLTDKKFQNHGNTADLSGAMLQPTPVPPGSSDPPCVVVIGEGQDRVDAAAKKLGARTIRAEWPKALFFKPYVKAKHEAVSLEFNRKWINEKMDKGCTILDLGPVGNDSPFYKMEKEEVANRAYSKCFKVKLK